MESVKIVSIRGVSKASAQKLSAQGIASSVDLLTSAATPPQRAALAEKSGIPEQKLLSWVHQADLLRVPGISVDDAESLEKAGVTSVQMLGQQNAQTLRDQVVAYRTKYPKPSYQLPTIAELTSWIKTAQTIDPVYKEDPAPAGGGAAADGQPQGGGTPDKGGDGYLLPMDSFFVEMSDFIVQLGKGIAKAQQALDQTAIDTQKTIDADDVLSATGVSATWYTIPEATLDLKMDYSVSKQQQNDGSTVSALRVSPMNATYRNFFKVEESVQSALKIKFAAVPPPSQVSQIVTVPDVKGKDLATAESLLKQVNLRLGTVSVIDGKPVQGLTSEIKTQVPEAAAEAKFLDKVNVEIVKVKE
jgi:hypothetical protein